MATAKTAEKAAVEATSKIESLAGDAQKAATEQFEKMSKSLEDVATFNQENIDAMVKSSTIAAKAVEEIGSEFVNYSKKSVEEGVAAAREISSVKSAPEFFEKQAELAKASFDGFVSQATRMSEMYMTAAKDVFEPLSARANAASDLVKSYRA